MEAAQDLAQAMIEMLAFFMPAFIVFLVVEWLLGLFRRDK